MATPKSQPLLPEEYVDITIDGLRYKARPPQGDGYAPVLEVYDPNCMKGTRPKYLYPREEAYEPIWHLYEAAVGRSKVEAAALPHGILQEWVAQLGLRHQGCLLSAVRGPDNEPKEGSSKRLTRFYRACVLRAHVGDPRRAATFMIWVDKTEDFWTIAEPYLQSYDHFHNHFVMHFLQAVEICGYKMPGDPGQWWCQLYLRMCRKLHLNPETEYQLDNRLNRSEADFRHQQDAPL